jgi:hypothetical protein
MSPELRRIVAVEVHRRRSGRCPVEVHSLGTGESFAIRPLPDGFLDLDSGALIRSGDMRLATPEGAVELRLVGDVFFEGRLDASGERFSGRAGGGASVTLYEAGRDDYFQFAVVADGDLT